MKYFLTVCMIGFSVLGKAQTEHVERSVYGIQTGLLGIWGHNETGLSGNVALRSELGFDAAIWGGTFYYKTGFLMTPVLTLEPRFYYNLKKRHAKSRKTQLNSGNFLSLKTSYRPDWFVISNYENVNIVRDISIIPTWGMRRHIGQHIGFETGFGLGYSHIFAKAEGYAEDFRGVALNLHLRFGYTF